MALRYGLEQLRKPWQLADSRYQQLNLTCVGRHALAPYESWTPAANPYTRRFAKQQPARPCAAGGVEEYAVPNAAWHFTWFGTAEDMLSKSLAISDAGREHPGFRSHQKLKREVAQCKLAIKRSWKFEYGPVEDVPAFVLRSGCAMRQFFAYARVGDDGTA